MARKKLTADEVATSARLAGVPPELALAIWTQESGAGINTATSSKGAVGHFQILPATFKQYNPGGDINDPVDNMNGALRYMAALLKRYDGDWEKVGQAYYHGKALAPGIEGPTSGPGTPTTRQYGQAIMAKAGRPTMQALATLPARATSTRGDTLLGNPYTTPTAAAVPARGRALPRQGPPTGPWVDPIWHGLTAKAGAAPDAVSDMGDMGPLAQEDSGEEAPEMMALGESGPDEMEPSAPETMAMGDLGPSTPSPNGYAGNGNDQMAMVEGGNEYELDRYLRKLVDELV